MTRLDTPLAPEARSAKAGLAGQEQGKHKRLGDRGERGTAFGALLKTIGTGKTSAEANRSDRAGDSPLSALLDNLNPASPGDVAKEPALPTAEQTSPSAATVAAAARLLLGPFQLSERAASEPLKDSATREGGSRTTPVAAGLSDLLADTVEAAPGEAGTAASHSAKAGRSGRPEAGVMMPGWNKVPDVLPDLAKLAQSATAAHDKAASTDLTALDELAALKDPAASDEKAGATMARDPGTSGAPTLTVLHQETHLPPVMRLSPFQQVIEPLRQAASELLATRSAEAIPGLDSVKTGEIDTPTKLLHLELKPVELGTIVVKLRLSHAGMEMRIETSRAETAAMLGKDTHALREVIRASGYSPDTISVETVHVDAAPGDWQRGNAQQDSFQNDGSGARAGRDAQHFRQGDQGQESRRQARSPDMPFGKDDIHDVPDARRPGGDPHLYL
jgi:chemotaxis protein MotD